MLVIKVENSFGPSPVQKDGALKSTKQESGLHGWGLKSVQSASEKYDGTRKDMPAAFAAAALLPEIARYVVLLLLFFPAFFGGLFGPVYAVGTAI